MLRQRYQSLANFGSFNWCFPNLANHQGFLGSFKKNAKFLSPVSQDFDSFALELGLGILFSKNEKLLSESSARFGNQWLDIFNRNGRQEGVSSATSTLKESNGVFSFVLIPLKMATWNVFLSNRISIKISELMLLNECLPRQNGDYFIATGSF